MAAPLESGATMKIKLGEGTAMRKKTIIALARQLAIDLWRWRTGRCTLADLGWFPLAPLSFNPQLTFCFAQPPEHP